MASKEKVKVWARKLAVESEPGLTNAQLMLTNHDLKPVEPERRQWGPWNFVGFWVADSFNIVSKHIMEWLVITNLALEHMDDFVLYDSWWPVLVAIMALCLDWVFNCCLLHLLNWSNWCHLSYLLSRHRQILFWNLGIAVACLQQSCHGLHMVRANYPLRSRI
jgi:hypothetical protein